MISSTENIEIKSIVLEMNRIVNRLLSEIPEYEVGKLDIETIIENNEILFNLCEKLDICLVKMQCS